MPKLNILVGDKIVQAELVMHEHALIPKVPDEFLSSTMPLMTARLEAKAEAADLLLGVGDFVRAAEHRFPELYGKVGGERAKAVECEYRLCREMYEAGKFDSVREKLPTIRGQLHRDMVSLELRSMVQKELKKKAKSRRVKLTGKDGQKVFQMAARFDGARLRAKLFGAETKEPVGELLELPKDFATIGIQSASTCSCECDPPSIDETGSVGYLVVVRRFWGGSLECQEEAFYADSTDNFQVTSCSVDEGPETECEKKRYVFFPEES